TYAYNEIYHRDINVDFNMNKTYRGSVAYTYNKNSKPWEPFSKVKFLSKSKWLALIKDFNLFLAPKVVSFRNDINRSYIENIIRANYGALAFPTYTKQFMWVRAYDVKYDITKNLKFDYMANNNGVIGEPLGRVNRLYRDEYSVFKDSVMTNIRQAGITTMFNHTFNINYQLPLSKLPLTDWISANARYQASYDWQRSPFGQDTLGNIIQNSRNVSINGQLNFVTLYNKIPYLRKIIQKENGGGKGAKKTVKKEDPGGKGDNKEASDTTGKKKKEVDPNKFTLLENTMRVLMMVKNASVTYSTTDGLLLPGYLNKTQFIGMDPAFSAPGFAFVAGRQNRNLFGNPNQWGNYDDYAFYAADQGWLIENPNLNKQYVSNHATNFQSRVTIEPFTGMKIELNADKNLSENKSSFFRYIDTLVDGTPVYDYQAQNPLVNGVMSMSIISWKTAFARDGDDYINSVFEHFRNTRTNASELLGSENPNSIGYSLTENVYREGYGSTQQDVVIAAFVAAYTGSDVNSSHTNILKMFPMPNWRITYDPMAKSRWKFFKNRFRSLTLRHGYRSTLNVSNYITNLLGATDTDGFLIAKDVSGNFINHRQINVITISEQFTPLIGVDIKWKMSSKDNRGLITKVEIKRDRNLTLSLTNNQLTEIRSKEYVFGTGYTFSKVKLPFKIGNKALESDLDCRADVSIRDNITVTRKIVENYNQPTSGQTLISIKTSITYSIQSNIQIRLFFDKTVTDPKVSTSFRTSNANSGLAIRLTL
ncbi:MAG: cell surface protein SprA, partial [Flavobacteriales bacterium]